ncbi:MAG: hypothetical protein EU517_00585 [Promethearchaeota archaeon]|nr:MAG: hypothetical protein EU517_00585 [Candidatus Lokiarchaeota archaeon]
MLDIILIQHEGTGINLVEYRQNHTRIGTEHSAIFSGFLSAIQNITTELNIGTVILISTKGSRGHNCIIVPQSPINVILLADHDDPIDLWREQGHIIATKFLESYGTNFNPHDLTKFRGFSSILKDLCSTHDYCE